MNNNASPTCWPAIEFPLQTYALIVEGHCMTAGDICDGDVVFIEPALPKDGDVIVAAVGRNPFMLKRYHVVNGKGILRADSPGYPEIPVTEDVTVGGVVVGLLRGASL